VADRDFDVVLYGATGFTGRQTAAYFAAHAPPGLRWAVAGRNESKLQGLNVRVPVLVADSADQAAIDRMVSRTRVLLTTAGPFALYGSGVVDACVRRRTQYVDITGETVWVRSLIDRYHERAAAEGTRIVPFCGFDCVPCDLGVNWIAGKLGPGTSEVKAFYRVKGGRPNGGTIASALNAWESGITEQMRDPFLLSPGAARPLRDLERDPAGAHFDSDIQAWVAPWVMGAIDTRVVRRSNAILGRDFAYQEYVRFSGRLQATAAAWVMTLWERSMKLSPVRSMMAGMKPGTGPSEKAMDEGWMRIDLFARATDGRTCRAVVKGQGDPANRITVKCLCESALALACAASRLPDCGGILTPSTAIGDALLDRLAPQGITVSML
jgi:short subunit dehydrogenase-like uncharacterized protein